MGPGLSAGMENLADIKAIKAGDGGSKRDENEKWLY